jgi:hypothetical protein
MRRLIVGRMQWRRSQSLAILVGQVVELPDTSDYLYVQRQVACGNLTYEKKSSTSIGAHPEVFLAWDRLRILRFNFDGT